MFRILLSTLLAVSMVAISLAAGSAAPQGVAPEKVPEVAVVIRVSKNFFLDLLRDKIEMTVPIKKTFEGYTVTGSATGKGETDVMLMTSDEDAVIEVSVAGTIVAPLCSNVGPAVVRFTTQAPFTTRKTVRFDGEDFEDLPATTENQNCTYVNCIVAKRRGPVGKLVERVGRRMAAQSLSEVNQIAEDVTKSMLSETLDEKSADFLGRWNKSYAFEDLIPKYFPEAADYQYRLASRPDFVVAGLGPPSANLPPKLVDEASKMSAEMELWLKLTPGEAAMLKMLGDLGVAYELFKSIVPDVDEKEFAEQVKLVRIGDWSVIQIGLPKGNVLENDEANEGEREDG